MTSTTTLSWHEANQRYLVAALAEVRALLEHGPGDGDAVSAPQQEMESLRRTMPSPPALEAICGAFGLSPFERHVLLACAGVELDSAFASLVGSAQGDARRPYLSFSLALGCFPEGHWSALPPTGPLRYRRLIEVERDSTLTLSPLHIEERVLHYLTGVHHLDERLMALVQRVAPPNNLASSHRDVAERMASSWSRLGGRPPLVQLVGEDRLGQWDIAAWACTSLGLGLYALSADSLPQDQRELVSLARLWERDAVLDNSALLLDCHEPDSQAPESRERTAARLAEEIGCPVVLCRRESGPALRRPAVTFEVSRPATSEQVTLWRSHLGPMASGVNGHLDTLASRFDLNASTIRAICDDALGRSRGTGDGAAGLDGALWDACRSHGRSQLEALAQRIQPVSTWDDLVLPEPQVQTLKEIAGQVRQRKKVYESWGFAEKMSRGLGISALFSGSSGTGKTMAAEVLANDLGLDLYRIDLSSVVSKYIGETEKNLRRVFDAAEDGGAVLLFDEADALFGKRSEVKDSHDRYANIEVGYLLQRMEAYRGLAILTTNMKSALDTAFLRRIRFVVQFPFPDVSQRAEMWHRVFPPDTPTQGLDIPALARLKVSGGSIKNIALRAAFLAADDDGPVTMRRLLTAAQGECAKLERSITDAEIRGWL